MQWPVRSTGSARIERAWLAGLLLAFTWTLAPVDAARASDAQQVQDLPKLPVLNTAAVAPSQFRQASQLAARQGLPVDIALRVAGPFEGRAQWILQSNEGVESPTASRVVVIRDGLLDDALMSERWDLRLTRTTAGLWHIAEVTRSWRCRRGEPSQGFSAQRCP